MKQYNQQFTVKAMSRVLRVSRSGYYDWLKRRQAGPGPRQRRREYLDQQVKRRTKPAKSATARLESTGICASKAITAIVKP